MSTISPKYFPIRRILNDVETLDWSRDGDCTFIGSLYKVLKYFGEETSYDELMGLSRTAFRLNFHQGWNPSSPDWYRKDNAAEFLGYSINEYFLKPEDGKKYSSEKYKTKEELRKIIKKEITNNRPVLAIDLVDGPDWGIIIGYYHEAIVCRTYYDRSERFSVAEKFPWSIVTINKNIEKKDKNKLIVDSLKEVGNFFFEERWEGQYNGLAAYEKWIDDLRNEELFPEVNEKLFKDRWQTNAWIYSSHYDARQSARRFLEKNLNLFIGLSKIVIQEVIEEYRKIEKEMYENWIYFPFEQWVKNHKILFPGDRLRDGHTWTKEMRIKGATFLESMKEKEIEIFNKLKTI
jgi:hypothetical protein